MLVCFRPPEKQIRSKQERYRYYSDRSLRDLAMLYDKVFPSLTKASNSKAGIGGLNK
jgi:hypothetical protein